MKILIYLGHPAHYHTVSPLLSEWHEEGHEPILLARDKDVLLELLEGSPYRIIRFPSRKSRSWWSIFSSTMKREWKMYRLSLKERPAALIGTDVSIAHAGYWTGTTSILLNEDDTAVVPKLAHLGFRYADEVIAPYSCDITPYAKKKRGYQGVHELSYLHPDRFTPKTKRIEALFPEDGRPYALIRVSALNAHHDKGIEGMDEDLVRELLKRITPYAQAWISSEKALSKDLEKHRLKIPAADMHHALAFAKILVGDSQTMTAEAAVLGTPSLRFSDLAGDLGYLEELEKSYGLTFGFGTEEQKAMLEKLDELLVDAELRTKWKEKQELLVQASDDPLDQIRIAVNDAVKKEEEKRKGGL